MTGRAHAVLSASGWKKWSSCPASAALEDWLPEEDTDFSREGTYGHDLGEALISARLTGDDSRANERMDTENCEGAAEFLNETFLAHVLTYVDFVIERVEAAWAEHGEANVQVLLETRVDFSRWVPEGFGRCDVIILSPGMIDVIDLKMGQGVYVEGKGNGQLRLYALGAYEMFGAIYEPTEVTVTIVQPRKENIGGDTITVNDLLIWADDVVKPRAALAWAAYQARLQTEGDLDSPAGLRHRLHGAGVRFSPGEHCTTGFCKARFVCTARARYMLEAQEQPFALAEPVTMTTEQLESVIDRARLAVKWLSDCERHLTEQALKGEVRLTSHELVEGMSFRHIREPAQAAQVLMSNGYAAADIYEPPRLRGLGVLEKLVGKKKLAELLADQLEKPPGEPRLEPLGSGRPPAAAAAAASAADATEAFAGLD